MIHYKERDLCCELILQQAQIAKEAADKEEEDAKEMRANRKSVD